DRLPRSRDLLQQAAAVALGELQRPLSAAAQLEAQERWIGGRVVIARRVGQDEGEGHVRVRGEREGGSRTELHVRRVRILDEPVLTRTAGRRTLLFPGAARGA